jgi:Flp pilus assembly pilin Flp
MKTMFRSFHQDQAGQALVETALILPLLLLLVFGFLELGLAIADKQKLLYVTNYAAQVGSLTNNDLKVSGAIEEFYDGSEITFDIQNIAAATSNSINSTNRRYNDIITVSLQKPFSLMIPFFDVSVTDLHTVASAKVLCTADTAPFTCQ